MPPALSDSTSAPGPSPRLEVGDELVARGPGQAAVVAGDRRAGALGEVLGEPQAPLGEVGEHEHPLAGREHRVDDLLEPGELARAAGERAVVVLVRGRVVADLLERGDRREDLALARLLARRRASVAGDELVEHRLVQADLLGRHRAVVELVDLVGQLGRDLRLGLGAAEHEDAVERAHRVLGLDAASPSPSLESAGDELRPRCRRGRGW